MLEHGGKRITLTAACLIALVWSQTNKVFHFRACYMIKTHGMTQPEWEGSNMLGLSIQGQYATTLNIFPLTGSPNCSEESCTSTGATTESSRHETISSLVSENANTLAQSTPVELASKGAAELQVPGEKSSRFGRTITPSTRSEKMNEISSTKENIPPVTPQQSTEWVTLVKQQLSQHDLGEDWRL